MTERVKMITKYECGDTVYIPAVIKSAGCYRETGVIYNVFIYGNDGIEVLPIKESDLVESNGRVILESIGPKDSIPKKWW